MLVPEQPTRQLPERSGWPEAISQNGSVQRKQMDEIATQPSLADLEWLGGLSEEPTHQSCRKLSGGEAKPPDTQFVIPCVHLCMTGDVGGTQPMSLHTCAHVPALLW